MVENAFARLKHFRGIATRYDKLKDSYEAAVMLACVFIWLPLIWILYSPYFYFEQFRIILNSWPQRNDDSNDRIALNQQFELFEIANHRIGIFQSNKKINS